MNAIVRTESEHIAIAAASLGDKLACRKRVLDALETIIKFDGTRELRAAATKRFLDLTNPDMKEPDL